LYREDAIRHLNGYQCDICRKRFGKKYGLKRHKKDKIKKCTADTADTIPKVSQELVDLLVKLESANGYEEIEEIMTRWKPHCG